MTVDGGAVNERGRAKTIFPMGTVQMQVGNRIGQKAFSPVVSDCLQRHARCDTGEMVELLDRFTEVPTTHIEVLAASGYVCPKREDSVFAITRTDRKTGEITTSVYQPRCMFVMGELVVTPGVQKAFTEGRLELRPRLEDHYFGYWGHLSTQDVKINESAVVNGGRISSRFIVDVWFDEHNTWLPHHDPLWIMTEADRSITTVLFASEY